MTCLQCNDRLVALNDEAELLNKLVISLRKTRQADAAKIAMLIQRIKSAEEYIVKLESGSKKD